MILLSDKSSNTNNHQNLSFKPYYHNNSSTTITSNTTTLLNPSNISNNNNKPPLNININSSTSTTLTNTSSSSSSTSNRKTVNNTNTNSLTSLSSSNHVANQVVIIHQNNSISTNCNASSNSSCNILSPVLSNISNKNEKHQQQQQLHLNQIPGQTNSRANNQEDQEMSEIKYMKGYVNVLKQRFTRKSLEKCETSQQSSSTCFAAAVTATALQTNHLNIVGEAQQKGNGNDFLRRRSVSPFHKIQPSNENNNLNIKPPKRYSHLTTPIPAPTAAATSSKSENRKLFASTDDLRNINNQSNNKNSNLVKSKILYLSNTALNHASNSILNEKINRDELPKPNFVSSVKNLFEKQFVSTQQTSASSLNSSLNNCEAVKKSSHTTQSQQQYQQDVANNTSLNLLDKLKQNGTLVYEHSENNSNYSINNQNVSKLSTNNNSPSKLKTNQTNFFSATSSPIVKKQSNNTCSSSSQNNNNDSDKENNENNSNVLNENQQQRFLSIKERKEIFSKIKQSNNININQSSHSPQQQQQQQQQQQKRIKIENSIETTHFNQKTMVIMPSSNDELMENEQTFVLLHNSLSSNHDVQEQLSNETETDDKIEPSLEDYTDNKSPSKMINRKKSNKTSTAKVKTYFGGEEYKNLDEIKSLKADLNPTKNQSLANNNQTKSIDFINFEFIGAGVKLEKSILIVHNNSNSNNNLTSSNLNSDLGRKREKKSINFHDQAETYEYPSYEFLLKELGIDPSSDPDYQIVPPHEAQFDDDEDEEEEIHQEEKIEPKNEIPNYAQFLPGTLSNLISNECDSIKANFNGLSANGKLGSFTNFKPSWHTMNYELGSMDNLLLTGCSESLNNERYLARTNGTTDYLNTSNNMNSHDEEESTSSSSLTNSSSVTTKDILPVRDEEVKRWSCDMDANILF
jgi:hypothetical protein